MEYEYIFGLVLYSININDLLTSVSQTLIYFMILTLQIYFLFKIIYGNISFNKVLSKHFQLFFSVRQNITTF